MHHWSLDWCFVSYTDTRIYTLAAFVYFCFSMSHIVRALMSCCCTVEFSKLFDFAAFVEVEWRTCSTKSALQERPIWSVLKSLKATTSPYYACMLQNICYSPDQKVCFKFCLDVFVYECLMYKLTNSGADGGRSQYVDFSTFFMSRPTLVRVPLHEKHGYRHSLTDVLLMRKTAGFLIERSALGPLAIEEKLSTSFCSPLKLPV